MLYSYLIAVILLVYILPVSAQTMPVHANGLIYPDESLVRMRIVVDSLNRHFQHAGLTRNYRAKYQSVGRYFALDHSVPEARHDIGRGIDWAEFVAKYRPEVDSNLFIVRSLRFDKYDEGLAVYTSLNSGMYDEYRVEVRHFESAFVPAASGGWITTDYPGRRNKNPYLNGFFLEQRSDAREMPLSFARLIQYSHILLDTHCTVFLGKTDRNHFEYYESKKLIEEFADYVDRRMKQRYTPVCSNTNGRGTWLQPAEARGFTASGAAAAGKQTLLHPHPALLYLLRNAVAEALYLGVSSELLEAYAERYCSKDTLVLLKRMRQITGRGHRDIRPLLHERDIAHFAAQTGNWQVFMRAHLNIVHDNFHRTFDELHNTEPCGSYIAELRALDVDVLDLLLGMCLHFDNPPRNHFFASFRMVGRAFAESTDRESFEHRALAMIHDNTLDTYNRFRIYRLMQHYRQFLVDKNARASLDKRLVRAAESLPVLLSSRL